MTNYALFLVTETFEDKDYDTGQITSETRQYACTPENLSRYIEHVNHLCKITIEKLSVNPDTDPQSYQSDEPYLKCA